MNEDFFMATLKTLAKSQSIQRVIAKLKAADEQQFQAICNSVREANFAWQWLANNPEKINEL
jgi:hypothetical protein